MLEGKQANPLCTTEWKSRLYTPTVIECYRDHTFIVDCWHHRVLYSADSSVPIERWYTLTDQVGTPHSIASDGTLYLTEDSVKSRILVFQRKGKGYVQIQEITDIGSRPHRIIYDRGTELFYGVAACSRELFILENQAGRIKKVALLQVEALKNCYTRSLAIIDRALYTVSGPGKILKVNLEKLKNGTPHIETAYNFCRSVSKETK